MSTRPKPLFIFLFHLAVYGPEAFRYFIIKYIHKNTQMRMPAGSYADEKCRVVAVSAVGEYEQHFISLRLQLKGDFRYLSGAFTPGIAEQAGWIVAGHSSGKAGAILNVFVLFRRRIIMRREVVVVESLFHFTARAGFHIP